MIKLADTLTPMSNDFYAVESENVGIDIDGTSKSIQQAYEDGDLSGGGSSIQVDTMPIASVDELGKIYEFIGSTGTYVNGYFYECVSDGEPTPTYSWVQKNVQPNAELEQTTDISKISCVEFYSVCLDTELEEIVEVNASCFVQHNIRFDTELEEKIEASATCSIIKDIHFDTELKQDIDISKLVIE